MLNKEFPCQCAHAQKVHNFSGDWLFQCAGIIRETGGICECQIFRPDNLRFIEIMGEGGLQDE